MARIVAASWAEKYRPRRLSDVLGNPQAVDALRAWGQAWKAGPPQKRALLLHGPPGAGKTSAAHATASEFGWGVIELNASDVRSATAINQIAGEGSRNETFTDSGEYHTSTKGQRKLIILDEADNLYERGGEDATVGTENFSDRGGRRAIFDTIGRSQQPILLIANDSYALTKGGSAVLQKHVTLVPFRPIVGPTLLKLLQGVAEAEEVKVPDGVLRDIVQRAHGDARSALNDLQAVGEGKAEVLPDGALFLGDRNRSESMYDAIGAILKGEDGLAARQAVQAVDEPPDFVLAWLDENTPREYKDPHDLAAAYEYLSRADVFLGRVRRRQNYSLWATATDLMTLGVTTAKRQPYRTPPYYQFPSWIRKMGATKGERGLQHAVAAKVATALHVGFTSSRTEMVPFLRSMSLADMRFAEGACLRFGLEEDEIRFLLGPDASNDYADQVVEHVESRRAQPADQTDVEPEPTPPPEASVPTPPTKPASRSLFDF